MRPGHAIPPQASALLGQSQAKMEAQRALRCSAQHLIYHIRVQDIREHRGSTDTPPLSWLENRRLTVIPTLHPF